MKHMEELVGDQTPRTSSQRNTASSSSLARLRLLAKQPARLQPDVARFVRRPIRDGRRFQPCFTLAHGQPPFAPHDTSAGLTDLGGERDCHRRARSDRACNALRKGHIQILKERIRHHRGEPERDGTGGSPYDARGHREHERQIAFFSLQR
jgi:hypothetical protein